MRLEVAYSIGFRAHDDNAEGQRPYVLLIHEISVKSDEHVGYFARPFQKCSVFDPRPSQTMNCHYAYIVVRKQPGEVYGKVLVKQDPHRP